MSHGRTLYRCGCLQSQCRCFRREGHVDRWLDHPCPRHPDYRTTLYGVSVVIEHDRRPPLDRNGPPIPAWEIPAVLADRDRLIDEARD